MVRTQISFEEPLYREARKLARRTGVSLAELCRRGLREVLSREQSGVKNRAWMRHAGALCSGDPKASERVDEVVYGRTEP